MILKIHGDVDAGDAKEDSYVITEDHYIDYLAHGNLSQLIPGVPHGADALTATSCFSATRCATGICGSSCTTSGSQQERRRGSWAIEIAPDPIDTILWQRHGVKIVKASLEDWIEAMNAPCLSTVMDPPALEPSEPEGPRLRPVPGPDPVRRGRRRLGSSAATAHATSCSTTCAPTRSRCSMGRAASAEPLLRAGVVRHVREAGRRAIERGEPAEYVALAFGSWSGDPAAGLIAAIREALARLSPELGAGLPEGSLADVVAVAAQRVGGEVLLILDQFEEYFLYHDAGAPFVARGRGPWPLAATCP